MQENTKRYTLITNDILVGEHLVHLMVPNPAEVKQQYQKRLPGEYEGFPYWTKTWPSAISLATFVDRNSHIVKGKNVLEVGAGLGLPSIVASYHANNVVCTDYLPEIISTIEFNIEKNDRQNMVAKQFDWRKQIVDIDFDVLIASDISYDTGEFEYVYTLFGIVLAQRKSILFSTPDRLQSRKFLSELEDHIGQILKPDHSEEIEGVKTLIFMIEK